MIFEGRVVSSRELLNSRTRDFQVAASRAIPESGLREIFGAESHCYGERASQSSCCSRRITPKSHVMATVAASVARIAPSGGIVSKRVSARSSRAFAARGRRVLPVRAGVGEVAQIADSLEDAIPTIAVGLSLGAILWSSAGALKGFAALLGGEEATASHILVKDPTLAQSLLERLQEGPQDNLEDRFAREAGKYSECPSKSKGGSLGTFKPGQMVKEFNKAVFEGPVGVIQGPVKTDFGWHLILVTQRVDGKDA